MTLEIRCPDPEQLRQFMLGKIPVGEAEVLGEHLLQCAHCADVVHSLDATDVLVQAARAAAGAAEHPESSLIARLMSRLKREPPPQPVFEIEATVATTTHRAGSRIGSYKVLQQIGEGGMGTVYMAEQTEPLRRTVALKVIKAGLDSRNTLARFEAERQALALLDHANIAKVFDAGTTASGQPFFVMELVKGVPITQYCDEHQLTPKERLELFVPVCRAAQHAHQKGIIHRDIKPSNVLVALYDGRPVPKIIDFGVAKATGAKLTERTLCTEFGSIVGTLEYMSPEQAEANQLDIDTRSDTYSLGVVLYELLTGTTPLERKRLKEVAFLDLLRVIREVDPPKPSTRLTSSDDLPSIAAQRGVEPQKLSSLVRGELDWIVMKCLEKDRNRRYETANGLALDLQRYLADEPVSAGPPSASYRLRKFARRNMRTLAVAAALGVMLFVAVGAVALYGVQQGRLARHQKALFDERARFADEQVRAVQRLEGIQSGTEAELYRTLLGQADALRNAREAGYRRKVWINLQQALALNVPDRNIKQLRDQVIACLGDPIGLEPIHDVHITRSAPTQIPSHVRAVISDTRSTAVAPDGQTFAQTRIVNGERMVSLESADGRTLRTSKAILGSVHDLKFSPDGQFLMAACEEGVLVWEVIALSLRACLRGPDLHSLAVDPTSRLMATRSRMQGIELWSLTSNRRLIGLTAPDGTTGIEFSKNGELLLATQGSQILTAWYVLGTPEKQSLAGHRGGVTAICFSPDGHKLASVAKGPLVHIWDVQSGTLLTTCVGHSADLQTVAFNSDGRPLASGDVSGGIRIWNPESGRQIAELKSPTELAGVNRLRFDPQGRYLLAAGNLVSAWDIRRLPPQPLLEVRPPNRLWDIAIHPEGGDWVFAAGNGEVFQYQLQDSDVPRRLDIKCPPKPFFSLCFSHDGQRLTFITSERQVATWNWDAGVLAKTGERQFATMLKLAVSPDHRWAAILDRAATQVVIMDLLEDREWLSLPEEKTEVWSLDWSPDGNRLALGLSDGGLVIWNLDVVRRQLSDFGISLPKTAVEGPAEFAAHGISEAAFQEIVDRHRVRVEPMNLLKDGQDRVTAQDYRGAEIAFRKVLELSPNEANAYAGLGAALRLQGDLDAAAAAYQKAIELKPTEPLFHANLGHILRNQGSLEQAISALRKALQLNPKDAWAWFSLGKSLHKNNDLDESITAYRRAIQLLPTEPPFFYAFAKAALGEADDSQGSDLAAYRKAVEVYPKMSAAHYGLSQALFRMGDYEGALNAFRNALGMPDFFSLLNSPQKVAESEKLLSAVLTPILETEAQIQVLRVRGQLHARVGHWKEAAADFSKVVDFHSANHGDYHMLAPLLVQCGELEAYRELCKRIVSRYETNTDPLIAERMAKDCLILPPAQTDLDAVARLADFAVTAGANHSEVAYFQFAKGLADYRQGHFRSSVERLQQLLAHSRLDVLAHMVLAMAHHQLNETDEAQAALLKGREIAKTKLRKLDSGDLGSLWHEWIIAHTLEREAIALIEGRLVEVSE